LLFHLHVLMPERRGRTRRGSPGAGPDKEMRDAINDAPLDIAAFSWDLKSLLLLRNKRPGRTEQHVVG